MLNNNVYYHGVIRKCIIGFGRMFSSIYIDRKQDDPVNGATVQRLHVPLSYAPKEKWLVRVDEDPTLENHTLTTLPRMSFEIIAYTYDSLRKLNRVQNVTNDCVGTGNNRTFTRTPVPYNIDMSLYIITKTQEDALQIVEQILPTFTPEYTMSINAVEELGIHLDVPVVLNSVIISDEFEGDFQTRRFVIHTINFQMKVNLFGPINNQGVIGTVGVNIPTGTDVNVPDTTYTAVGDIPTRTIVSESWIDHF
jgi:hypothetical protein